MTLPVHRQRRAALNRVRTPRRFRPDWRGNSTVFRMSGVQRGRP